MTPDFNSISHLIEKVDAFKTPDGELFENHEQAIAHIMYQLTHKIVPESRFPSWNIPHVTTLLNSK